MQTVKIDLRLKRAIEASIFASEEPLSLKDLASVIEALGFESNVESLAKSLEELKDYYNNSEEGFGFVLTETGGGYQFLTHPEAEDIVAALLQQKSKKRLSKSMLETLAIIAYKQPVTRPELDHLRGVNSDYAIHRLLERDLITIKGKSDSPGKPLLYATSAFFMDYFGINSLSDLPKIRDIQSPINEIGEIDSEENVPIEPLSFHEKVSDEEE